MKEDEVDGVHRAPAALGNLPARKALGFPETDELLLARKLGQDFPQQDLLLDLFR